MSGGILTAYDVLAGQDNGVVLRADSDDALTLLPDRCCHAIVTDPPYGLAFMGRKWDSDVPGPGAWEQCLRVAVPGAHLLAFGSARRHHRLWAAIEDAGWEIRGTLTWHYGQGFPKGGDVSKGIDKAAGAEREVVGTNPNTQGRTTRYSGGICNKVEGERGNPHMTAPATEDAKKWAGWQANLKPATEFICLARAPLSEKNLAANVLRWGAGALNIGGRGVAVLGARPELQVAPLRDDVVYHGTSLCGRADGTLQSSKATGTTMRARVPADLLLSHHPECRRRGTRRVKGTNPNSGGLAQGTWEALGGGRGKRYGFDYTDEDGLETVEDWDCHPDCPVRLLNEQSGHLTSGRMRAGTQRTAGGYEGGFSGCETEHDTPGDTGGASRFFPTIEWTGEDLDFIRFRYCPKASRSERTCGGAVENRHPTVKPVALMRWLVGLVARPGQLVLDPFAGSGTTGIAAAREGLRYILIEQDAGHAATARKRIAGGPLLAGS